MAFLPELYEALKTDKAYWKPSQMKEGENRLRIVSQPIAGWIDWQDKKPLRYRPDKKPARSVTPENPIRPFWDCYVWDYAREGLYILEITQMAILKSLTLIAKDEDWGDFTKYDVKINKEGSGKDTRYTLTPLPPKPMIPKIKEAIKAVPVRLEALYDGGDPWTDLDVSAKAIKEVATILEEGEGLPMTLEKGEVDIIASYLEEDPEAEEKLLKFFNVSIIGQIDRKDFAKVVKSLQKRREERELAKLEVKEVE